MPTPVDFTLSPLAAEHLTPSPTLALNEEVNRLWAAGETVYHMGFGESRFPVHPVLLEALVANAGRTSYPPTMGIPVLRDAVAAFYRRRFGLDVSPAHVMVGPGSKSLIFAAQMALDADLILPTPSWVSYAPQARLLGRRVHHVPAQASDGWALDLDALDETLSRVGNRTRALVLNSPNNPLGTMLQPSLVERVASLCRERGVPILSDEIYALTAHGDTPHVSPASVYREGCVVFGGLSKHLSLGGWRLGVAIAPRGEAWQRLLAAMRVIAGEIWSSPSAPVQYAAALAYAGHPEIEGYIDECAAIHAARTRYLYEWLVEIGLPCPPPDGGFYLFPNFNPWRKALAARGVRTSDELARYLLRTQQIAALPGAAFGLPPHALALRLATSYVDMEDEARAAALLDLWRAGTRAEVILRDHHPALNQVIARLGAFVRELNGEG